MPKQPDVEPTALKIDEMAIVAERLALDLRHAAQMMRDKNSLEYAAEAVIAVTNAITNFRLDLMVTRPLRETMK